MIFEDILDLLREAIRYANAELDLQERIVCLDDSFSALGIDSIAALEMAAFLEEKLGIQFPDNELAQVTDVRGFAQLVERHMIAAE